MKTVNDKFHYCRTCHRNHFKNEEIEVCEVCNSHIDNNKVYDLKIHNLHSSTGQGITACESCTTSVYKKAKEESDNWIEELKDGLLS